MLAFVVLIGIGLIKIMIDDQRDRELKEDFDALIEELNEGVQRRLS